MTLHMSAVSFYLIIRTKKESIGIHAGDILGSLDVTYHLECKEVVLFFHCAVSMWACTVERLLILKNTTFYFLPGAGYIFIISKIVIAK